MSADNNYLDMFTHEGLLGNLNDRDSINGKVDYLHKIIRERYAYVDRISIAIYDAECDLLKTFAHSTDGDNPLSHYQAKLSETDSLQKIVEHGRPRIVNDLSVFDNGQGHHTKRIKKNGFLSSYTVPLYLDSEFTGFVFFNSRTRNAFCDDGLSYLDMITQLISLLISGKVSEIKTLHGALKTATEFTSHRDPETGAHLERMARFVRVIACDVAEEEGFDEEHIERLFWYAPLHDIGKIAIPDSILLKNGPLTDGEFSTMRQHADKGGEIIVRMLDNFQLMKAHFIPQLINIARYHHENIDGSGYPEGLKGNDIPVEARIVAVADVFDALTSDRPYKTAWSNDDAFAELKKLTAWKLDDRFVTALEKNRKSVEEIQQQFRDEPIDWT